MCNTSENQIELILIRHARTEGNLAHKYIGNRTDEDILDSERKLIDGADKIQTDFVFSSPLKRCIQTAECLTRSQKIIIIDNLKETDFGNFEGKNYEELNGSEEYQHFIDSGGKSGFPEGESYDEFNKRTMMGFEELINYILNMYSYNHKNDKRTKSIKAIAVVHGGTIMAILSAIKGGNFYDYQVKNICGYKLLLNICEGKVECSTVEIYSVIK